MWLIEISLENTSAQQTVVEIQLSMRVRLSMFSVSSATFIRSYYQPVLKILLFGDGGGGGGEVQGLTPLYGLYGDVPLDRVWFLSSLS